MKYFCIISFLVCLSGCNFNNFMKDSNCKFADQAFKTTIALVELHKIRNGEYPNSLEDIRFKGDWDMISSSQLTYKKLSQGYKLDLTGKDLSLSYPKEFWKGLDHIKSNMRSL